MFNLQQLSRLLYSHNWDQIEHWATAIDQLADLTDIEIIALQRIGAGEPNTIEPGTQKSKPWFPS